MLWQITELTWDISGVGANGLRQYQMRIGDFLYSRVFSRVGPQKTLARVAPWLLPG
jgi:hypothetical protein